MTPYAFTLFPSVSTAMSEARARVAGGQAEPSVRHRFTASEPEIARRFDASAELKALRERRAASVSCKA